MDGNYFFQSCESSEYLYQSKLSKWTVIWLKVFSLLNGWKIEKLGFEVQSLDLRVFGQNSKFRSFGRPLFGFRLVHYYRRSATTHKTTHFEYFEYQLPIKVVQSFANACISTHLSHIIDSIDNSFLISRIFEVHYLRLSQITPRLARKLHNSDLSSTFIDSNMDLYIVNVPKHDGKTYYEPFRCRFQVLQQW